MYLLLNMLTVCVSLLLRDVNYNTGQNVLGNVEKSSKNGKDQKILI